MSIDSKTPQAFPYSGEGDEMNYSKGMTLRDYFAAKAMEGIYASNTEHDHEDAHIFDAVAEAAYKQADAMLKARKA
jgi:hypothetical protein